MSRPPRPAAIEFADMARRGDEGARSLGTFLGIPAAEARAMLDAGSAGPAIRSRRADPVLAGRLLEKRLADPWLFRVP
jgi:hypothetical protein